MIPQIRSWYNQNFTLAKYQDMLDGIAKGVNHVPPFRIAESPFFIPNVLKERLLQACDQINDVICSPNFKSLTEKALIAEDVRVPNEDEHTTFLQMDFGITLDEEGLPKPMLIEIQGFPSVYFFQNYLYQIYNKYFDIPPQYAVFFNGMNSEDYVQMMKEVIVGESKPESVVMLEIEPEKQTTYIDFICTQQALGIKVLCISKVIKKERQLYYMNEDGQEIRIEKIYNRVIFDELNQRPDLYRGFDFMDDLDVQWIGHPNWFYRISKFTMPLLTSEFVPTCYYLSDLDEYPSDLENYVLKPLYSFAGSGVIIDVDLETLNAIKDPENYILQQKVTYHPVLDAPGEPVKCEVRMLMLWKKDDEKPIVVNNLVRLSKGKMIGVKYNKDKDWVGGTVGYFEV